MGDPFDFFIDEGGWPYPDADDAGDLRARGPEPIDLRSDADDDLVALHALAPRALAELSDLERAAVTARFGLTGSAPMTMSELGDSLGLSRDRTRVVLAEGLGKLRSALADGRP
jgi:DNA-directed RNA polymerase specialized sigma24 family protein